MSMNPQDDSFSACNLQGIPSIQNMISQPYIKSNDQQSDDNLSYFDINNPFKSSLLISDPHLPIFFVCLLQRILKKINLPLSKRQNKQIIKGTWNIMIKFWKDYDYEIYRVNKSIEWGLLQLINFQFYPKKKQRFQAEEFLRKQNNYNQIAICQQKRQESQPFCTLQHIQ